MNFSLAFPDLPLRVIHITHLVIDLYMRWVMPPSNKRIVICCDGTFDDFGDTIERKKPGSHTSRVLRWLLPPVIFHVLWGLRVFACIKSIERNLLGTEKLPKPFHSDVSRIASAIKPRAAARDCGVCWWHRRIRNTTKSIWGGGNGQYHGLQDTICLSGPNGQSYSGWWNLPVRLFEECIYSSSSCWLYSMGGDTSEGKREQFRLSLRRIQKRFEELQRRPKLEARISDSGSTAGWREG